MDKVQQQPIQGNINLNIDATPVFFTDNVFWNISPDGVVLNFGQTIMGSNQIKIMSRVGMSKDLAKKFVAIFEKNLTLTEVQGQAGKVKN